MTRLQVEIPLTGVVMCFLLLFIGLVLGLLRKGLMRRTAIGRRCPAPLPRPPV